MTTSLGIGHERHWILKPRNSRVFHQEVLGWIGRHLGPVTTP